jgi:hypothetical protein
LLAPRRHSLVPTGSAASQLEAAEVRVAVEVDHRRFVNDFLDAILWWARGHD